MPGPRAVSYPDANFQSIAKDMRRLRPASDQLATALAANNQARIQDNEEAVIPIVKDCARKLSNGVKAHGVPLG